jgi:hypothetical protein
MVFKLIQLFLQLDSMDLLSFAGRVGSVYTTAIYRYKNERNEWVKIGDLPNTAFEVAVLPVQGISCYL